MRYVIIYDGMTIAKFLTESDRDLCLGALREVYDDAEFEVRDEGGE